MKILKKQKEDNNSLPQDNFNLFFKKQNAKEWGIKMRIKSMFGSLYYAP